MKNHDRSIEMNCPTCGSVSFSGVGEAEEGVLTCASCGLMLTKDALIEANGENISMHVAEVKKEIAVDVRKAFLDAFKGNKNFRIK